MHKLGDLVQRLDIENYVIRNFSELDSAYSQANSIPDFQIISQGERERTLECLKENLI